MLILKMLAMAYYLSIAVGVIVVINMLFIVYKMVKKRNRRNKK